jgi:hypothetical protein
MGPFVLTIIGIWIFLILLPAIVAGIWMVVYGSFLIITNLINQIIAKIK